jgi:uncharacterized membrane protein
MTLEPIFAASPAIRMHLTLVAAAIPLGAWLMWPSRKGSPAHRKIGITFMILVVGGSIVSLFIRPGETHSTQLAFWLTHITAVLVPVIAWMAISAARKGNIPRHRFWVGGLFMGGLMVNLVVNLTNQNGLLHQAMFGSGARVEARLAPRSAPGDVQR